MDKSLESAAASLDTSARRRVLWPLTLVALWFVVAVAGLYVLVHYANTSGQAAEPPKHWPEQSVIALNPGGSTLVMFVHPHCPCSRASLSELQRTIAHFAEPVSSWIVFYKPSTMPPGWEQSDLWHTALGIPQAHVISDVDGVEARRFHVATSGQALLYDSKGNLQFSGGITSERGHEGDNAGETSIVNFVNDSTSQCRETPVFGCPIVPSDNTSK